MVKKAVLVNLDDEKRTIQKMRTTKEKEKSLTI